MSGRVTPIFDSEEVLVGKHTCVVEKDKWAFEVDEDEVWCGFYGRDDKIGDGQCR